MAHQDTAQQLFKVILLREDPAKHREPDAVNDDGFADRLRKRLKNAHGADVEIETFAWSGANSHGARRLAAGRLRRRLEAQQAELSRYDAYFLAAHGLSGSVARLALNMKPLPLATSPRGVFTFGASFIRFTPRPVARLATLALWMMRLLLLIGLALALDAFLLSGTAAADSVSTGRAAAYFFALATPVALITLTVDRQLRRARTRLVLAQRRMLERYDPPDREATPYVCYHAAIDEAGLLTRVWSVFTRLFQIAVSTTTNALFLLLGLTAAAALLYFVGRAGLGYRNVAEFGLDERLMRPMIRAAHALLGGAPAESRALVTPGLALESLVMVGGAALLALLAVALLATPVSLALPRLARSRWLAFGGEPLSWMLASEIRAELAPNALSEVKIAFFPRALSDRRSQHDFYLRDRRVINDMASRMAQWRWTRRSLYWRFERFLLWLLRTAVLLAVLTAVLALSVAAVDANWFGLFG